MLARFEQAVGKLLGLDQIMQAPPSEILVKVSSCIGRTTVQQTALALSFSPKQLALRVLCGLTEHVSALCVGDPNKLINYLLFSFWRQTPAQRKSVPFPPPNVFWAIMEEIKTALLFGHVVLGGTHMQVSQFTPM